MSRFLANYCRTAALFLLSIAVLSPQWAKAQSPVRVYGRDAIPFRSDGWFLEEGAIFTSWSLFLPCNPKWLVKGRRDDLVKLYDAYYMFAAVSGLRHAAVWFERKPTSSEEKYRVDDLDIERSARYCEVFQLPPSGGPYVVVTTTHPDRWQPSLPTNGNKGDPAIILAFDDLNPGQAIDLLSKLNDQLAKNKLSEHWLNVRRFYLAWSSALESVCGYFRDLKLTLNVKFVSLEKASVCP